MSKVAAYLRGDREKLVASWLLSNDNTVDELVRREAYLRWLGIASDPRIVRREAQIRRQLAEADAKLPEMLASEGLSMMPRAAIASANEK